MSISTWFRKAINPAAEILKSYSDLEAELDREFAEVNAREEQSKKAFEAAVGKHMDELQGGLYLSRRMTIMAGVNEIRKGNRS